MYTPDFHRRGILPTFGGSLVLRLNDVSTFSLNVNGDDYLSSRFEKGWRVVIQDEGVQLAAGQPNRLGRESKSGAQDLSLSGADDFVWLKNMITLPNPANRADNQSEDAYYKASGTAGTLLYDLVRRHSGQNARAEYKRPLVVTNPGAVGKQMKLNSRFKPVLEEAQTLANSSDLVMRMQQDDAQQLTTLSTTVGRDLSRAVRMTEKNDGVADWSLAEEAPELTHVLVAGQGEGEARTLKLVEGNENEWGFWGLQFQDRRDTDEVDELIQAGEETLEEGRAKSTISVEVQETESKRFGLDFWLGDTITVQLADNTRITDKVQVAEIDFGAQGRTVKLTLGPVLDEQDAPRWVPLVSRLMKRLQALQTR